MSTTANSDYSDLLCIFNAEGVEYLVVGAHALAAHGHPRYSEDLDVWVRPIAENAERVYRALARFGAPLDDVRVEDFTTDDLVLQIGIAPVRIDVLTSITGVSWEDAWRDRMPSQYGDNPIPVLGRMTLIANKRAAGRPKDLLDVAVLEASRDEL